MHQVGYRFDWGDVMLVYRNLSYSTTGNEALQDMRAAGPAAGRYLPLVRD